MIQDVFIIGATGNVGSTLVKQIFEEGDTNPELHPNPTRVVGLASSTNFLCDPRGLSEQYSLRFITRNAGDAKPYSGLLELVKAAEIGVRSPSSSLIFVDVTATGEEMTQFHLNVIKNTPYGIVTANKNPVASSDYKTFQFLTANPKRYGYRCSVMAGADAVPFLRDATDLNDRIDRIEGCLSGTNMYLLSRNDAGLSKVVREVLGKYTEPDPRDDLSGFDVARKLVVLARTAGFNVGLNDVALKPFIPQEYFRDESIESFLERLEGYDNNFADLVSSARERGNVLRYVATMIVNGNEPLLEVALKEVPIDSNLGMIKGRTNKVLITTRYYPEDNPYPVEGPGAGLEVTARNIRRELLEMLPERISINGRAVQ